MATVNIHKAKTELSKLIARVEAGEEIIIARYNKPAVRLVKVEKNAKGPRKPGRWKGKFTIPEGVFDPLSDEELKDWEDGPIFPPKGNDV